MRFYYSILALLLFTTFSTAQEVLQDERCGTQENHQKLLELYPEVEHRQAIKEQEIQKWISERGENFEQRATYTIPVVFHVVYKNSTQNISDTYINAQLEQLNQDFQATNTDYSSVPSVFPKGNVNIEFCLATIDPNGVPTSGVTRTQTSSSSVFTVQGNQVKSSASGGVNPWNTNQYFNIWVCDITNSTGTGEVLGYAQFPQYYASSPHTDGLVLGYKTVGSLTTPNPLGGATGRGRTATHELGHCLGLYHIWGDDDGSCSGSDLVNDTPNQADKYYGCPTYPQYSCNSADMHMNFMDYTNDACMHAFTVGQAQRVAAVINQYPQLQSKIAAAGTVCNTTPPDLSASFTALPAAGCTPLTVYYSNTSQGASNWVWEFPGGTPSSYVGQNPPAVTYYSANSYTATLTVSNSSETLATSSTIVVNDCSEHACSSVNNLNNASVGLLANTSSNNPGGYVCGHNAYNDKAKAEYFSNIGNTAKLNGIKFEFGHATGTGNVEFVIWADNGGTPGAELKTQSIPVSIIAQHIQNNQKTRVDFGGFQDIPNSFFAGIKLGAGNEVALKSNSNGDTSPTTAWEMTSNNTWQSYNNGNTTWQMDISMSIHPNICYLTSVEDIQGLNSMSLEPNPVSNVLNVRFNASKSMKLQVEVYNAVGQKVVNNHTIQVSGETTQQLDVSTLPTGMYFLKISDGKNTATEKFSKL